LNDFVCIYYSLTELQRAIKFIWTGN